MRYWKSLAVAVALSAAVTGAPAKGPAVKLGELAPDFNMLLLASTWRTCGAKWWY